MKRKLPIWTLVAIGPIVGAAIVAGLFMLRAPASEAPAPPSTPPPAVPAASTETTSSSIWATTRSELKLQPGETQVFTCPEGGTAAEVVGHGPYTGGSSICTAAVHAGLITFAQGGTVTVVAGPGQPQYGASSQNGVLTSTWGPTLQSFLFQSNDGQSVPAAPAQGIPLTWASRVYLSGATEARHMFWCPPGGSPGGLTGTDVYTADSSPCTAAVHAGHITLEKGGPITIEVRPGEAKGYVGSERNGIASTGFGPFSGWSFVVVGSSRP